VLSEVQLALEKSVREVTGQDNLLRTGTVVTELDRNWELRDKKRIMASIRKSRAIAVDMESATIAANGFRHRFPYGTLLRVSDNPFYNLLKMPGSSEKSYNDGVGQHLRIGIKACEILRKCSLDDLHSRKLRSPIDPPFR
jgi:AMP nucleosidase